eukprot:6424761-Lingulodinium_polyedra.AAC.1
MAAGSARIAAAEAEEARAARRLPAAPYWIRELIGSLEFEKVWAWRFCKPWQHINVKESVVIKSLLKHCSIRHPGSNVLDLIDSK